MYPTLKKSAYLAALMAATCLVHPHLAYAQLQAADSATKVYNAPNGVPVVDIAKTNGAGVSHNRFNSYNVDTRGVVLNNGNTSQLTRASELAGQVAGNTRLSTEANVIVNEVVQPGRSVLAGFTEVVGKTADVVVANPYGITCNGCGFINTPNVSLTTGLPVFNGTTGALTGFQVQEGDILITGTGINAAQQDYLGLISRSLQIQGQINAKTLDVVAGANDWDYNTRTATATGGTGAVPSVAIDSSALGGMYARRIRLIATEAGVGVRLLGEAAASVDDFTISSSGKVRIGNKLSAERDLTVTTTSAGSEAILLNDKIVSAGRDLALTANAGGISLLGGALTAERDLGISSATLVDVKTSTAGSDTNKRYALNNLTLTQTGSAAIDGTIYGAGNDLSASADSLTIGANGATFYGDNLTYTTANAMLLNKATLKASEDITLLSTAGGITTVADAAQGIQSTGGNIEITAHNGFTNAGVITADAGDITAYISGTFTNSGTLYADDLISIADENNASTGTFTNSGTVLSDGTLTLKASSFTNSNDFQATQGATITVTSFDNSGTLIASATNNYSGTIVASTLTNSGTLQSAEDLSLTVLTSLNNTLKIIADDALTIRGNAGTTLAVTNSAAGTLQAGGILTLKGDGTSDSATLNTQAGKVLGDTLDIKVSSLSNTNIMQGATGASTVTVTNTLTNSAAGNIKLGTTSAGSGTLNVGTLSNSGTVESKGALAINATSAISNVTTNGKIISDGNLAFRGLSAGSYNVVNNGLMQSTNDTFSIDGYSGAHAVAVTAPSANALFVGNAIDWNVTSVSLAGSAAGLKTTSGLTLVTNSLTFGNTNNYLYAGGVGTINISGSFSNNAAVHAQGNLNLTADSITNTSTGGLSSNAVLTLTADNGSLSNSGALFGNTGLSASATTNLTNNTSGTIDSNGGGTLSANTFTNYNDINYAGNLIIDAAYFYNRVASIPSIDWSYTGYGFDPDAATSDLWANYGTCGKSGVPAVGGGDYCALNGGTTAARDAAGNSTWETSRTQIESEGFAWAGWNVWENTDKWYVEQSYNGSLTPITDRPTILSNGGITIRNFAQGQNMGGVISAAGTLNVNGAGGSTFENNALTITRQYWVATWYDSFDEWIDGSRTAWYHPRNTASGFYYNKRLDTSKGGGDGVEDIASVGATMHGSTVNVTNTALSNVGSVDTNSTGASVDSASAPTTGTAGTVGNTTTGNDAGAGSISFGGISITLPTNPNGFFVVSQNPNSSYLVETNPKFADPNLIGSDYMAKQLGLDINQLEKRLGDAAYETSLIRQQLINQLGTNLIDQEGGEVKQMQMLLDNGVDQSKKLGLTYGKAPTAAQLAGLESDMVWMVETTVNGQKVLAPVVYLSANTKSMFQPGGAVIAGNKVNMDVTRLTNTGGTIQGKETLNVTSQGDITNTSGSIKGGDVSLTSKLGSIVNETWNKFTGDDSNGGTSIGKTGSIESTGNLNLDAKKDIKNKGADMTAGKDASLKAGENITFDTIVDKKAKTTESVSGGLFTSSSSSVNEVTSTNIGSNLKVGGNLKTDSGKDTTIRGSNVDVKGDGDMKAGGNLNILDVQDESRTVKSTSTSGVGVGGGVYGMEKETDDHTKKTSVGSKLKFGGKADLSSDKDLTIQGSDLETGSDLSLKGDSVNILEGRNEETRKTTKETTTFLSTGSSSSSDSGTDTTYNLSEEDQEAGKSAPDAGAGAHANASASGSGDLSLMKTTKTETTESSSKAKGSNIKSGGNLKVESNKDTTVRGSNVEAAGDVDVNAGGNLNIEAAKDTHTKTTKTSETSIGFHASSENKAEAGAQAGASADAGGATANAKASKSGAGANVNAGNANADASAEASAEASSDNTLDLMRHTETETNSSSLTHTKSTIKSGGNTKLKAKNDINVKGSDVEAGGDLDVDAGKNLNVTATEDRHETTTSSSKTSVGLYAEAAADAKAGGKVEAGAKTGASGEVSAEANASAGIGLQGKNVKENSTEGSTKANTSSLKSGGNMKRKAGEKITDEGTQIEAGGDYEQDSKEWESKAAKDTTWSSKDSESNKAKVGLYAEANAEAHASGEAAIGKPQTDTGSEAGASAGVKASYERETKNESATSSKAVTSTIKSGGKLKTTTTGKTSLEGTNLESGGDMEVNAGSLDYKAARDTETSSKGGDKGTGEIKVGVDATKAVTGSLKGGYEKGSESESSSMAVVGGMKSGGKLKVNTKGDANFEGTNIESADDASVSSDEGSVNFNAARDTKTSTSDKMNVEASISASKSKGSSGKGSTAMGFEAKGGMEHKTESEDNAVTGSIKSGGKLDVKAKKNVTMEGTAVESTGDTTLDAGENVDIKAAKSTKKSEGYGFEAELGVTKGGKDDKGKTKGTEGGLEAKGNYEKSDETTSTAGSIKSGSGIKVKSGKNTTLEGTNLESEGKTSIDAGGDVNFKAAEDKKTSIKVEAELELKKEESGKSGNVGGSVEGGKSNTKKAGSIKAGEIEVKSKGDTTLEGTKLDSKGDTTLDAGGNLNLKAAESSHIDGSIGGKVGSDGPLLKDAGIGGGVTKEGVDIKSGGNLKMKSGGKTTLEGTKAKVEGKAEIDAEGGVEKKSTVSGGGQIGTSRAGAEIDVQDVDIDAKGGYSE